MPARYFFLVPENKAYQYEKMNDNSTLPFFVMNKKALNSTILN